MGGIFNTTFIMVTSRIYWIHTSDVESKFLSFGVAVVFCLDIVPVCLLPVMSQTLGSGV